MPSKGQQARNEPPPARHLSAPPPWVQIRPDVSEWLIRQSFFKKWLGKNGEKKGENKWVKMEERHESGGASLDLSAVPSAPPAACGADTVGRLGKAVKTRKKTGKNREKMGEKWARYGLKRVLRSMRERRRGEPEPEHQPRRVSAPPRRPDLSWNLKR